MKFKNITQQEYEQKAKELNEVDTDFFGNQKLSTLCNAGDKFSILTFENKAERDTFIKNWKVTVQVSRKDRGYKGHVSSLRV